MWENGNLMEDITKDYIKKQNKIKLIQEL
jgi:hypothetical protein